jgi:hypothetical protein
MEVPLRLAAEPSAKELFGRDCMVLGLRHPTAELALILLDAGVVAVAVQEVSGRDLADVRRVVAECLGGDLFVPLGLLVRRASGTLEWLTSDGRELCIADRAGAARELMRGAVISAYIAEVLVQSVSAAACN